MHVSTFLQNLALSNPHILFSRHFRDDLRCGDTDPADQPTPLAAAAPPAGRVGATDAAQSAAAALPERGDLQHHPRRGDRRRLAEEPDDDDDHDHDDRKQQVGSMVGAYTRVYIY